MKRLQTTDFDVITGPSMASACPIIDSPVAGAVPPAEMPSQKEIAPAKSAQPATAKKADAA